MRIFNLLILFIFILPGCLKPVPSNPPPVELPNIICHVRPIIVTNHGISLWGQSMIDTRVKFLHAGYRYFQMDFDILPTEIVEKPEWFNLTTEDQYAPNQPKGPANIR